jgi:DNA-directed RNA polymerase specialized sigma24 family protein
MEELLKYLKALVALQVEAFNNNDDRAKAEILLARAGLSYLEIADIVGKSEAAVAKSIQRAK